MQTVIGNGTLPHLLTVTRSEQRSSWILDNIIGVILIFCLTVSHICHFNYETLINIEEYRRPASF